MEINNLTKKQKILLMLIGIPTIFVGTYFVSNREGNLDFPTYEKNTLNEEDAEDSSNKNFLYVEITGQVTSPGVYQITKSLMVIELIQLAGGLTEFADLETVHKDIPLSSNLEDRQKIYIPALPLYKSGSRSVGGSDIFENGSKVNINTATSEQLDALPDVGPATANKIISSRPYKTIEDLKNVEGIGEKTYNNLITLITL